MAPNSTVGERALVKKNYLLLFTFFLVHL
jgi:hypothetical protein